MIPQINLNDVVRQFMPRHCVALATLLLAFSLFTPQLFADGFENPLRITGELTVLYLDDLDNHRAELMHIVEDKRNNKHYRLIVEGAAPGQATGAQGFFEESSDKLIRLKATAAQGQRLRRLASGSSIELLVKHADAGLALSEVNILGAEDGTLIAGDPDTAHYAPALGERKVAVLLVNFLDNMSEPGTPSQAQSVFDNQINDYFREVSYNQAQLTTDVYGWWTLPYETSRCSDPDLYPVSNEILEEAARRGIDLTPYDHLVYVFNEYFGIWCGNGTGTVSPDYQGKVWRTWTGTIDTAEVAFDGVKGIETTIHELGHNLGLWHANRLDCGTEILSEDCTVIYYGDFYDAMGSGPISPHFNAFHKERLGWISPDSAELNRISTVSASGIHAISPYAAEGGVKALRIRRGADAAGGSDAFYLEFRQPLGWDDGFKSHVYEGLLIHLGNDTLADSSRLLNTTPADIWEHVLRPGLPFHDPVSDVTIELLSISSDEAIVDIVVGRDITPPKVSIGAPLNSEALVKKTLTTIRAQALDETAMGQVAFYVDGKLACTDPASSPDDSDYACAFTIPNGRSRTLLIEARASDAAGNTASASVQVSTIR